MGESVVPAIVRSGERGGGSSRDGGEMKGK